MPQKHSTIRDGKRLVWYTEKLWNQSRDLSPFEIEVSAIKELDENCWFGGKKPTPREIARHCKKINNASLKYPIILNADGSLMDGGHRLCKAILEGYKTIKAVQFTSTPKPDEVHELAP